MTIAVAGCRRVLPLEFPLTMNENAGNVIHGNAPFEMFDDCVHASEARWRAGKHASFAEFVNRNCSHLVMTFANTLRLGEEDGAKFSRLLQFLRAVEAPVVVFGLGVQASDASSIAQGTLPAEAVALIQHLSERSPVVGVRGEATRSVIERLCGVTNVVATGCPSLFSRPDGLARLPESLEQMRGRPAFNATKLHLPEEKRLFHEAMRRDHFMVESVNRFNHKYYVAVSQGDEDVELPYFLRSYESNDGTPPEVAVRRFFESRYRLFRDTESWYAFNAESVSFTYGTRFHGNMASILAGKPALWVTHDQRTSELTELLSLPSASLQAMLETDPMEIPALMDYAPFFDTIGGRFDVFNEYLAISGLPNIQSVAF